jgi:hypothetical protein
MNLDPDRIDILKDVTYQNDIKGSAVFVIWRGVPLGSIRPMKRIPNIDKRIRGEARKALRDEFRPRIGKWYISLGPGGGVYYETKEEAARQLVIRMLKSKATLSPILQAALQEDYSEVERLSNEIRESTIFEDESPRKGEKDD